MRRVVVLSFALALTLPAGARACPLDYGYAGVEATFPSFGIAATISGSSTPSVRGGHVAAWVGVGGQDSWLQAGLATFAGGATQLYYELRLPRRQPVYRMVDLWVPPLERHRVAVAQAGARGWWRVWANGIPVSPAFHLPGSDAGWRPFATGETWGGCNEFEYYFDDVRIARADKRWVRIAAYSLLSDTRMRVWPIGSGFATAADR